jgi:type II secretory pathway pseudopilin PulG
MGPKGVHPLVAATIIVVIAIATIAIFLTVALPVIERVRETITYAEARANMATLDRAIQDVALEGEGSSRAVLLTVSEGLYEVNPEAGTFEFSWSTRSGIIEPGTYLKRNNLLLVTGGRTSARQTADELILENEILRVTLQRVGNETYFEPINTSQAVKTVELKETGLTVSPADSLVIIGGILNSGWGTGYSKLVRQGAGLTQAEALFHIESQAGPIYEILYTLPAMADFLIIEVMNVTEDVTTNLVWHLGPSREGDLVKVGGLAVADQACFYSDELAHYYACVWDGTELAEPQLGSLIYAGLAGDFLQVCAANVTTANKFNLTFRGEQTLLLPITRGTCDLIDGTMYQIEKWGIPATSFVTYVVEREKVSLRLILTYGQIRIAGTGRFPRGSHRACVENVGTEAGKPVVAVIAC